MTIRKTTHNDLPCVMQTYAQARAMMRESGNPSQWQDDRPTQARVIRDIEEGNSYVCEIDGQIAAVFYFNIGPDPTYVKIDGAWLNDMPYSVVHRIARTRDAKGVGAFCLDWCYSRHPNIRIDTHRDNAPMLTLMERLGFKYCGIIWIENGDERMAFQRV